MSIATPMNQLYARVFVKILDSSIAEDFFLRHVFEDLMKVASRAGIVDITRQSLSRRLNIPLEPLNEALAKLEAPDANSSDPEFDGRRIERLDPHRDWGWRILNWSKYDALRTQADVAIRVARHRAKKKDAVLSTEKSAETFSPSPAEPSSNSLPTTESAVRTRAAFLDLPPNLAVEVWRKLTARGGKDGNGQVVRNFDAYLKSACEAEAGNVRADQDAQTARLLKEVERL